MAATGDVVAEVSLGALGRMIRRDPPDVLLPACTGPTVRVLTGLRAAQGRGRPVLVTGLPWISIPASARAVGLRRGCDLLVVHSRREREEFDRLAGDQAPGLRAVTRRPRQRLLDRSRMRAVARLVLPARLGRAPSGIRRRLTSQR